MLRFFHKYQKSVVVYIFIGIILFSMVFFGIDMFGAGGSNQYALKIDNTEITEREVSERRQIFEAQLRQQFGNAFDSLWEYLKRDLDQRIVDSFIEEKLLDQITARQELGAANADVRESLIALFQGQFSPELYQSYLAQRGVNAREFEKQLAGQVKRTQLLNIINDLAESSNFEATKIGQREEAKIDLEFVSFDSKQQPGVAEPDEAALRKAFEENLNKYELPPRVKYTAVVVNPEDVINSIDIKAEDIEMYYAEHAGDYKKPARARVAHIQMNFGKDSTPEALNQTKSKAEEIRELALRGDDFNALVVKHSDDIPTKLLNGSLGWIEEGGRDDAIAKAALALKAEGVAELVSTDYGFHIVKVLEYEAAGNKDLKDVEGDIKNKLKQLEAPAIALVQAEDILNRLQSNNINLSEFAKAENMKLVSAQDFLTEEKDIDAKYAGLTKKILENPTQIKQLVELGNSNFVVEILDYKDTELPDFAVVKDQIKKDLIAEATKQLARQKADDFLASIKAGKQFADFAKEQSIKIEQVKSATASGTSESILKDAELRQKAFRQSSPGLIAGEVFKVDDNFVVAQVTKIEKLEPGKLSKPLDSIRERVTQNNAQAVRASLLKASQAKAKIDVSPGLLAN